MWGDRKPRVLTDTWVNGTSLIYWHLGQWNFTHLLTLGSMEPHPFTDTWVNGTSPIYWYLGQWNLAHLLTLGAMEPYPFTQHQNKQREKDRKHQLMMTGHHTRFGGKMLNSSENRPDQPSRQTDKWFQYTAPPSIPPPQFSTGAITRDWEQTVIVSHIHIVYLPHMRK